MSFHMTQAARQYQCDSPAMHRHEAVSMRLLAWSLKINSKDTT